MKNMRKNTILGLGFLLVISAITFHTWLSFDIFSTGDSGFNYSERSLESLTPSSWSGFQNFGSFDVTLWRLLYNSIEGIFGFFNFDSNISEKFLIMFPVIVLFPYISYLFLRKLKFPFLASIIGSFVFCYNSYFLSIYTHGHIPLAIAGVWGVFALYFLLHLVEKKRVEWAILAGMMLSFAGYYDFRFAYIFFFICGGFLLVSWVKEVRGGIFPLSPRAKSRGLLSFFGRGRDFRQRRTKSPLLEDSSVEMTGRESVEMTGGTGLPRFANGETRNDGGKGDSITMMEERKNIWKLFWMSAVFVLVFAGLNVFWILPFATAGAMSENAGVGRDLFGNDYFELQEALFLSHPFWTGYGVQWMSNQPTPWWLTILGILAFAGFWVGRKNPYVVFFALIALIGIFLGKQVDPPFGNSYYWLYENLPGFNAFREASKFYVLIALGYSVGLASLINWLLPKEGSEK